MVDWIPLFLAWPMIGFLVSLAGPEHREQWHAHWARWVVGVQSLGLLVFCAFWLQMDVLYFNVKEWTLFSSPDYAFYLDFYFDRVTAVFAGLGAGLAALVVVFSRVYLHREAGYKRFFNTVLFFFLSYNVVVFSGNLETLFIGWEGLGITSFLLIAFYRERFLPVKNAIKVFSIYRIGDVGLLLAMWMSHHFWLENVSFVKLLERDLIHDHLLEHSTLGVALSISILVAAMAKSAQWPFTSWLPRAMEGPTPSSAIFYGSLSVHIGAFLLLRTHPFWENQTSVVVLIAAVGALTSLISTGIARVQPSIKAQIAYSSAAQIGLIFIEIALGWDTLALFHTVGNASLRTYQLLVSPSSVTVLIREQVFSFNPVRKTIESYYPKRLKYTLYLWSLKEFNLDTFHYRFLWDPFKRIGRSLRFLGLEQSIFSFFLLVLGGTVGILRPDLVPFDLKEAPPVVYMGLAVVFVLRAFSERKSIPLAWGLLAMSHTLVALSIGFTGKLQWDECLLYLGGIYAAYGLGLLVYSRSEKVVRNWELGQFHGLVHRKPVLAGFGLLATLGISGFPITTAFLGEDLLFSHIAEDQFVLAALMAVTFVVDGLAAIRIFARVFLGPDDQNPAYDLLKTV
jgi:NADH:ubiquinone oxidoreductase subunit 5 (subunit L)/multisubunit Na+/H+ antiporter MnhA subunit